MCVYVHVCTYLLTVHVLAVVSVLPISSPEQPLADSVSGNVLIIVH